MRIPTLLLHLSLLSGLAFATYSVCFSPIIYSDDWSQIIGQYMFRTLEWVDVTNRRPLLDAPLLVMLGLFGLNLPAFYVVIIVSNLMFSVSLYFLVQAIGVKWSTLAFVFSALVLVYPADYTRLWLANGLHSGVAWLLTALYAWCVLRYADGKSAFWLLISSLLLLISLGLYEAQLGLAVAWCIVVLVARWRTLPWFRRLAVVGIPLGLGVAFVFWRTAGYQMVGITDPKLLDLQSLSIGTVLQRLLFGAKTILIWSWTVPLQQILSLNTFWALTVICAIIWLMVTITLAGHRFLAGHPLDRDRLDGSEDLRSLLRVYGLVRFRQDGLRENGGDKTRLKYAFGGLAVGILTLVAGYVPSIANIVPNLNSLQSRVNFLPGIGGALIATSGLAIMVTWLVGKVEAQADVVLLAGAAPLLALGTYTHICVQCEAQAKWEDQKSVWTDLLRLAPQLKDSTVVYFIFPGYESIDDFSTWSRPPLRDNWEITAALRTLYQNTSIEGDAVFPDVSTASNPVFTQEGVVNRWSGVTKPYRGVVFYVYDGASEHLSLLEDIQTAFDLPWPVPEYRPENRVVSETFAGAVETHRVLGILRE